MPKPIAFPKPRPRSLSEYQTEMDGFVAARGWYETDSAKPQNPRNLAMSISIEANELLECFQWTETINSDHAADELADVVLYAAQLANVLGIDLGSAVDRKLEANHLRFPVTEKDSWRRAAG